MQRHPDTADMAIDHPVNFLEEVISAGPGITVVVDHEGNIVYSSRQFEVISGKSADVNTHHNFFDFLQSGEADRLRLQLQKVEKNVALQAQYGIYRFSADMAAWYIYASGVEICGVKYYRLFMLPESSKQKVPFLSFDSRELYLEQFSVLGFGTFEWPIGSEVVFWSDGVYDIYEMEQKPGGINYEYVKGFTHPEDTRRAHAAVQRALEEGGEFSIQTRILTPTQKVKTIHSLGRVIADESGKPVKLIGSIRDVTEQTNIEHELEKNIAELNRSNKELEEFAYVASHDLQEPLRKISTFCGRLAEKYSSVLTGDGEMYMSRILASADNMRNLINNLLEFSRVTRDTQPFEPINLSFVVRQVKSDLELLIEETGTTIDVNGDLPAVSGSLSQLKQLFTNIIGNAIKFRKADEKSRITVSAEPLDGTQKLSYSLPLANNYSKITIQDNGIGFSNEYAERIFQIFQRLNGKAEYPGSGIGLAICKKIVEHHHGIIYAESEEGKGAKFIIILPVVPQK
ncbi:ATP-binding protein [Polluticoccus soli]|uniref:PAS domain-containing sensor histidine kinase n=1 Tax=Polluticoccus soli TaxID=3034150 RepID=UPI0023E18F67|nr:ATP-binding protein [Flavipsychrobacter sp. JY13-12]